MFEKRVSIFTGHFGSGKTEVAVNYALKMAEMYEKVAIVDMDIVNPFFRTADVKNMLEERGIKVILPQYANTNVDVPSLPAEINTVFENKEYHVVLDIGGDDLGAKVVSRYRDSIIKDDYDMYFVVNTRRPMTDSEKGIEEAIYDIEYSSRLKVAKLVNNTNLLNETTLEYFNEGDAMIRAVSEKLGIPVGFVSGLEKVMAEVNNYTEKQKLVLGKLIKLPWEG